MSRRVGSCVSSIFSIVFPAVVGAAGLEVGAPVPAFSLSDQNGVLQSMNSLKGPNGLMLVFYRSADW